MPERVLEQRRDREPVGEGTHHAGLGGGGHIPDPRCRHRWPRPSGRPGTKQWPRPGNSVRRPSFAAAHGGARRRRRFGAGERFGEARPLRPRRGQRPQPAPRGVWSVCHSYIIRYNLACRPCRRRRRRRLFAVVSSGSRERTSAIVAQQIPPAAVKTDGRKRRWHQHKVERRNELVDGTLVAIRRRGSNVSMDEIAAEIGVSKTVLYRYFVDKNDLTTAVMMRFAQTTLIPNMAAALSVEPRRLRPDPRDHPGLCPHGRRRARALPVRDGEQLGEQEQGDRQQRGDHRPHARRDAAQADGRGRHGHRWRGALGVSHVGGVQLATHSWMSHPRMSSDELIDYLTMLSWSALCGIVEVGGSLEKFREMPSPVADPAATAAQEMSEVPPTCRRCGPTSRTPIWCSARATRSPTSTPAPPRASRARRPTPRRCRPSATSASPICRRCSTPTAKRGATTARCCWCCRAWTPRAKAASSNTLWERLIRWASGTPAFGVPTEEERKHHYLWRIRQALPPAGHIGVFDRSHYEDVLIVRVHNMVPPEVWGHALRRDQHVREEARRRRHDDRQGGDVRLARRAEEATGRTAGATRQVLEVQPGRHRRAAAVAQVPRGLPGVLDRTSTDYAPWHVVPCDRSGTAGWPSPSCSSRRSSASTCLGRQQISTSRPRRSGSPRPSQPLTRVN